MSRNIRLLPRYKFRDKPISMEHGQRTSSAAEQRTDQCGCAMCRLRRKQFSDGNHSLSEGVYDPTFCSDTVHDKSPRASMGRAAPNKLAEINRRNAEFWSKRGGIPE